MSECEHETEGIFRYTRAGTFPAREALALGSLCSLKLKERSQGACGWSRRNSNRRSMKWMLRVLRILITAQRLLRCVFYIRENVRLEPANPSSCSLFHGTSITQVLGVYSLSDYRRIDRNHYFGIVSNYYPRLRSAMAIIPI